MKYSKGGLSGFEQTESYQTQHYTNTSLGKK